MQKKRVLFLLVFLLITLSSALFAQDDLIQKVGELAGTNRIGWFPAPHAQGNFRAVEVFEHVHGRANQQAGKQGQARRHRCVPAGINARQAFDSDRMRHRVPCVTCRGISVRATGPHTRGNRIRQRISVS